MTHLDSSTDQLVTPSLLIDNGYSDAMHNKRYLVLAILQMSLDAGTVVITAVEATTIAVDLY